MAKKAEKEQSINEYIIAQLEQPVLTTQIDENGQKVKRNATDPRDGHVLTAKEAIAMKLMQNAVNGDVKAAKFIMEMEQQAKVREAMAKINITGKPRT